MLGNGADGRKAANMKARLHSAASDQQTLTLPSLQKRLKSYAGVSAEIDGLNPHGKSPPFAERAKASSRYSCKLPKAVPVKAPHFLIDSVGVREQESLEEFCAFQPG